jgi:hypothetical protein
MIEDDPFELDKLKLPPEMVRERCITVPRKIRHGHFVKVPCWWIERLARARYTATYRLAMHLLYRHWKTGGRPILLPNGLLKIEGWPKGPSGAPWGNLRRRVWSQSNVGLVSRQWSRSMCASNHGAPACKEPCTYMLHDFPKHGAPACIRSLVYSVSLLSYFYLSLFKY